MKLVQLNIWGGRLGGQILDLLNAESADIVCLQEVVDAKGDGAMSITLSEIAEKTGYKYVFMSPVFSYKLMNKTAHFGNAILSKHPISSQETIFTNLEHRTDFDFDEHDYNIRNLQHVVIDADGQKLNVLNHHGHHIHEHKMGDEDTLRQTRQISEYIGSLEGPVVLTGDFNLAPDSESLEVLNKQLHNQSIIHKLETTRTDLTRKKEVCDYIFTNDGVNVSKFYVAEKVASDHQALVALFSLR